MIIDVGSLDVKLLKLLQSKYMRNLAEELCSVQPMNITDPATNESIFTWTYTKQVFERNAQARWEDDGGLCHAN
jgi:hypothetical protein